MSHVCVPPAAATMWLSCLWLCIIQRVCWQQQQQLQEQHPNFVGKPVGLIPLNTPSNSSYFPPEGVRTGLGAVNCDDLAAEMKQRLEQQQPRVTAAELRTMMAVLVGRRCRCVLFFVLR